VKLLTVLFAVLAFAAAGWTALPAGTISIEGNSFVSDSLIIRAFGIPAGSLVTAEAVAQGIRDLFSLGYFSGIDVDVDSTSGVADLRISIVENRILSGYDFEGLDELNESDLRDTLMLFPGQTVSLSDIESARQLMLGILSEKHRHEAVVGYRWDEPDAGGRSRLVFEVLEGPDIRVGEIDFIGNTVFDDRELRGEMKTRQDSFWRSGRYRETDFAEDLGKIERYYRDHGYPDARVVDHTSSMLADGRHMRIEITVFEGRHYTVGDVSFTGNEDVPDSTLQKAIRLEPGAGYRISRYEQSLEGLYEVFQDRGYFYASVDPVYAADTTSCTMDVRFDITEGDRAHIRRIDIIGNTRTMDNVIRREFTVHPGDMFSRASLMRSLRNVYYLNYFNDVVPDFRQIEGSPDVDLVFSVDEKSTGKAGFGAGYGASDGFNGFLELGEQNLFGRGQVVAISYEFSKSSNNVDLSYTEPWFRDTPLSVGGEIFHTTSETDYYNRTRTGGAVTVGRPLPFIDYTSVGIRYSLERTYIYDITDDSTSYYYSLRDTDWPRWTSSTRFRVTRDSRDRQVFPGDGSLNILTAEYAGGPLGGNIGFQKYLLESSWFTPTFWRFVFMLRSRTGLILPFGGRTPPAYELFELGGTGFYGVRGYESNSIGALEGLETVGGKFMSILTAEYRLRVIDQIQLSAFFDAGGTWSSVSAADLNDMRRGAGLGFRIEVPMLGLMGLDYAYGFDGPDQGWEPHFQFGTDF